MNNQFSIFKKILVSVSLLFCFNVAQAAPSDCMQLSADGEMDCIPAKITYKVGTSADWPKYPTLEELIQSRLTCTVGCISVENKTTPTNPYPCYSGCENNDFTRFYEYIGETHNVGAVGNIVTQREYSSKTNPSYWRVNRSDFYAPIGCPKGYATVIPGNPEKVSDRLNAMCKPPKNTKTMFCNDSGGSRSSGKSGQSCVASSKGQSSNGDPVSLNNRLITNSEIDYKNESNPMLFIERYSNSVTDNWTFNYSRRISFFSSNVGSFVTLIRDNGQSIIFKKENGIWKNNSNSNLGYLIDKTTTENESDLSKYEYRNSSGELEGYTKEGFLSKIESLSGKKLFLSYETLPNAPNSTNTISYTFVEDENNNKIRFRNDSNNPTACSQGSVTNIRVYKNDIQKLSYNYSGCNLSLVTFPNGEQIKYTYGPSNSLSSKIDENGDVFVKWATSTNTVLGKVATSHGFGDLGNINKNTYTIVSGTNTINKRDALNNLTSVQNKTINGLYVVTGFPTGICSDCDGFQGNNVTYDTNGNVNSYTDFNNNIYQNTYDAQSRIITKKEAVGTALERQISYTWHLDTRLLATKTQAVSGGQMITEYIYDDTYDLNNVLSKSLLKEIKVTAPNNDESANTTTKTWKYYYNTENDLIKIENPRYVESSGVINDLIELTYQDGNVSSIINGKNQTVTFANYNEYGKPSLITNAAGRKTELSYDIMGRVLTSTYEIDEITSFEYDKVGQITKVKSPTNTYQKLYYDTAHRLTKIEDYNESDVYLGKTEFTLDNMSNMISVAIYNSTNVQLRVSNAQYDNKNRLYKTLGALNQTNTYLYDSNSNLIEVKDPLNNKITSTYDALNRLSTITNPDLGVMSTTYGIDNNVATVTDPKGLTTSYTYNGFGDLIKLQSPDSGLTEITYDIGSNPISYKDARNQISNYSYDELNRLVGVSYVGSTSENVSLTYDVCTNGIGLTCSVTDSSGTRNYSYNPKGRLASKEYVNGTFSKIVGYNYSTNGQLSNMVYPSGKVIEYTYSNDNIHSISYTDGVNTTNILNSATYEVFNSIPTNFTWGNNATYAQNFNKDGLISSINTPNAYPVNKSYIFDSRDNITNIIDPLNGLRDSSSTYDNKSRINTYNFGVADNAYSYTYNTSDDRLTSTDNASISSNYSYDQTSHKLTEITGNMADVMTYDSNGNILNSAGKTYTYNAANRMSSSNDGVNTTNYLINFSGERTRKTDGANTTWFIYDDMGNMIAEYDHNGDVINEYIYMDGNLIGLIKNNSLHYVYTDHLGTPRAITDTGNNLKWVWENKEAFGKNSPDENISGAPFNFNMRFPGQYYDVETGLNYNVNRDYNPNWGRYVQSDPIGLMGGINTYGYVGGNSLSSSDPLGLKERIDTINYGLIKNLAHLPSTWVEELFKPTSISNGDLLRLTAHGSVNTLNSLPFNIIGQQLINGEFKTSKGIIKNNYINNMIANNKDISITLDACNTGAKYYLNNIPQDSYAEELGKYLKKNISVNNPNYKGKINIKAPNGAITWWGGLNIISKPTYGKGLNSTKGEMNEFSY